MLAPDSARPPLRALEGVLTTCLVLLKVNVLRLAWGKMQGFDDVPWIDVFHVTHWFQRLPDPKSLFGAYHPPLSYLLCRWIYAVYPHEVEASQILSSLAILGATFALRSTLRTVGVLWTLPGLVMLYVTASLPLLVWMAIETSYDALVFMWFTVALAVSTRLFWEATPAAWWKQPRRVAGVAVLGLVFALGLFTKFNALFALMLPFLVVLARRGWVALLREVGAPLAAVALGAVVVARFYYTRYYVPLHAVFPSNMDWLKANDIKTALVARDADRWHFLTHLLRFPKESVTGARVPVRDSFFHSAWFHLWKRDADALASVEETPLALVFSDLYIRIFAILMGVSAALLSLQRRRLPAVWRSLGMIFFPTLVVYAAALVFFGWKYPLWDWTPIKAKYMTPGVFWVAYCAALPTVNRSAGATVAPWLQKAGTECVLLLVLLFMFINHLLPVY
jgi:hypothetical protein